MSDIKLFRLQAGQATELQGDASDLEKPLQTLIEKNLDTLLGIRFLASEYATGKTHGGSIDSLGLDENDCPVILEYKRSVGEKVINQGLFYLDWLMDHQAEFKLLELANTSTANAGKSARAKSAKLVKILPLPVPAADPAGAKAAGGDRSCAAWLPLLPPHLSELVASLEGHVLSLGDDVQRKELKLYVAFKRLKSFATVVLQRNRLLLYLRLDPAQLVPMPLNGQDVSQKGHWGTGDLELSLSSQADLDAAKLLILMAYERRAINAAAGHSTGPPRAPRPIHA